MSLLTKFKKKPAPQAAKPVNPLFGSKIVKPEAKKNKTPVLKKPFVFVGKIPIQKAAAWNALPREERIDIGKEFVLILGAPAVWFLLTVFAHVVAGSTLSFIVFGISCLALGFVTMLTCMGANNQTSLYGKVAPVFPHFRNYEVSGNVLYFVVAILTLFSLIGTYSHKQEAKQAAVVAKQQKQKSQKALIAKNQQIKIERALTAVIQAKASNLERYCSKLDSQTFVKEAAAGLSLANKSDNNAEVDLMESIENTYQGQLDLCSQKSVTS